MYNKIQRRRHLLINVICWCLLQGELHGLFSRKMVEYIVENDVAKKYLEWCWDTGHPSEHYWNTLNYNKHLQVPGGYTGKPCQRVYVHVYVRAGVCTCVPVYLWMGMGATERERFGFNNRLVLNSS